MGTTAARKARMILDNAEKVVGIELFVAAQALWLRGEEKLSPATKAVYDHIRASVPPAHKDIVMHYELVKLDQMVKSGELVAAAEAVCGKLL